METNDNCLRLLIRNKIFALYIIEKKNGHCLWSDYDESSKTVEVTVFNQQEH